jgi:hypothetical protein
MAGGRQNIVEPSWHGKEGRPRRILLPMQATAKQLFNYCTAVNQQAEYEKGPRAEKLGANCCTAISWSSAE